jgi:hypothetical protein
MRSRNLAIRARRVFDFLAEALKPGSGAAPTSSTSLSEA